MRKTIKSLSAGDCSEMAHAILNIAAKKYAESDDNKQVAESTVFESLNKLMNGLSVDGPVPAFDTSHMPIEVVTVFGFVIESYVQSIRIGAELISSLAKVYEGQVFDTDHDKAIYKHCLGIILKKAAEIRVQNFATRAATRAVEGLDGEGIEAGIHALKIPDDLMDEFKALISDDE